MNELSEQQLERLASRTAKKTVQEVFEKFGMDVNDARSMQADFIWVRGTRLAREQYGKIFIRTLIALSVGAMASILGLGLSTYF